MHKTESDPDVILHILKSMMLAQPHSIFVSSLHQQYCERGSLSRKQLEGLRDKAGKVESISPGRLATLQAIIMKKPQRHKSDAPKTIELPDKDIESAALINAILSKYPAHKRVLFLKARYDKGEILAQSEKDELIRFNRLLATGQ